MNDVPGDIDTRARALMEDLGLARATDVRTVRPLTGGVASDIAVVEFGDRAVCVKFALPKLRVAADWRAPVHRNRAEYRWLEFASSVVPGNVPKLYGWSPTQNGFAMEYLHGDDIYLWKSALLAEKPAHGEAAAVGELLGRIHGASTGPGFDPSQFRNRDDFSALRIEPYLLFTAAKHPDLAPTIQRIADALYAANIALVHGDVSPKNILFRTAGPILLDAECATMGDPAFDVAFCLNHLVLKAIHLPATRAGLLSAVEHFWAAYAPQISWDPPGAFQRRVAALLPILMLARVDGKSPVEYLAPAEQDVVRACARPLIAVPQPTVAAVVAALLQTIGA